MEEPPTRHATITTLLSFTSKFLSFGYGEVAFAKQLVPLKMVASYWDVVTVGTVSTERVSEHGRIILRSMSAIPSRQSEY